MEEQELVRLMVLESDVEAKFLQGFFADHGIQAMVTGIDGSAFGAALDGPDEIALFVKPDQVETARDLVEELLDNDDGDVPAWTCDCGEDVDEGFFVCWSCGAEYKIAESEAAPKPDSETRE